MNQQNNTDNPNHDFLTVAMLGTGSMGSALARAMKNTCGNEAADGNSQGHPRIRLLLSNRTKEKAEALSREVGGETADNLSAAAGADYIFLGVKPQMMKELLSEIAPVLLKRAEAGERFILVTMAAGLTMETIETMAGVPCPVIRIMPNTPAGIGRGVILYSCSKAVTKAEEDVFTNLLSAAGLLSPLAERLMDAGSAVSGCGPAFVYMFIEALADGGVACGLPRKDALLYAAQMVAGSAELVLSTGTHPGALKDAVCSPGGTTIEGVRTLEEAGFRGAVIDAVIAAFEKNAALKNV